ncbi:MAG: sugar transferase [Rhizomicrobium sp.]|jgi:lipopolysaccharide/colanic/teichoic acid biosynthesis glycosyltransferase
MNAPVGEVSLHISQTAGLKGGLRASAVAKRVLDLLLCVLLSPVALVIGVPIAVVLRLDGGRILYSQPRVGAHGRSFQCLKFRSMVRDADEQLQQMLAKNPRAREEWEMYQKLSDDPRVTWLGRFLRAYSLDELPQFINVWRGDMSIVGPRPIMVDQVGIYGEEFGVYCAMKPGITGLWQVNGRNDRTFADRVRLDMQYANTWSISGDLLIMARTLPAVLARRGAK